MRNTYISRQEESNTYPEFKFDILHLIILESQAALKQWPRWWSEWVLQ